MKKFVVLIPFFTGILFLFHINTISAQMDNASPSGFKNEAIRQKLKDRLDKTVQGIQTDASSSAALNSAKLNKWRATFGTVVDATGSSVTIETLEKDQVKVITVKTTDMILFPKRRSQRTVEIADIKPGWFAIAMGSQTIPETLEARRVSFTDDYTPPLPRTTVVGKISEIDEDTLTIVNGKTYTVEIPKDLTIKIKDLKNAKVEDITINDKALAVIETSTETDKKTKEEKTVYSLRALYVVPSLNNPKAATNQINTASTSAEASPAASPKASPKPSGKATTKTTPKPSPAE